MWDKIQAGHQCCGVEGPSDYNKSDYYDNHTHINISGCTNSSNCHNHIDQGGKNPNGEILPSCCGSGASNSVCSAEDAHQTGCYQAMKAFIKKYHVVIFSIASVVAVCQIIASAAAFCLASAIKKNRAEFSAYGAQPQQGAQPPAPPPSM